jgi:plasmid stabilization system protein ParE
MAEYEINVLQIAQDDMKSIVSHIRLDDPDAAIRMTERIKTSIGKLADYPLMGAIPHDKKIAEKGYRFIVVEPYLVFYIPYQQEKLVEVHRVLHEKQNSKQQI